MKLRVLLTTAVACAVLAAPASAGTATEPTRPQADWYTQAFHDRVLAAGADGVQVAEETLNVECPGFQQRGVSAAGCIVAPAGCTANFIFTDGSSHYVGTARHCVDRVGDHLVMQVDTITLADVGRVVKHTSGDGDPGHDFALIKLDPAVVAKWGVNPAVPLTSGPRGVYDGCDPQLVLHYGHGYGVAVSQGKLEGGLATNWNSDGFGWTGFGAPGDSGSPVVLADGRGAGNFTHLIVNIRDYPGSDQAGTRLTKILQFAGVRLVNADGSTSTSGPATCEAKLVSVTGGNGGGRKPPKGKKPRP
jgi:hypothetical protein